MNRTLRAKRAERPQAQAGTKGVEGIPCLKTTQKAFFGGKFMGSDPGSGVVLPSFEKLAGAYGLPYFKLANNQELDVKLP